MSLVNTVVYFKLKSLKMRIGFPTKHTFQISSRSLKWLYLTLKMHLIFSIVLAVKMCEMFPVKCKPSINLAMVFFVWQPANVIYVTGHRAMSLLRENREKRKKSSRNSQDGRLVVISCFCLGWGGTSLCLCFLVCKGVLVGCAAVMVLMQGGREVGHV